MTRAARRALSPALCLALAFLASYAAPAFAHGAATAEVGFRLRDLKVWQSAATARVDLAGAPNPASPSSRSGRWPSRSRPAPASPPGR